jgi:arabinogalactan oligomer/maltooligosaccharide transport system substrate-binding protein
MLVGTPMPTVLEMRCIWDSVKPEMLSVLSGTTTPEAAVESMQQSAEACIAKQ